MSYAEAPSHSGVVRDLQLRGNALHGLRIVSNFEFNNIVRYLIQKTVKELLVQM